jgi:hypothetical protein
LSSAATPSGGFRGECPLSDEGFFIEVGNAICRVAA